MTDEHIDFGGVPIKLISEVEAELVDYVVCMRDDGPPYPPMADHFGTCGGCFQRIYWSKSSPILPRRICVECALEMGNEGAERST